MLLNTPFQGCKWGVFILFSDFSYSYTLTPLTLSPSHSLTSLTLSHLSHLSPSLTSILARHHAVSFLKPFPEIFEVGKAHFVGHFGDIELLCIK